MSAVVLKDQCKELKLGTVADVYATIPLKNKEQFLTELFSAELAARKDNRARRNLKRAGFPQVKTLDTFEWEHLKLPTKTTPEHVTDLVFMQRSENLILMGEVGTGKTHLATALGLKACMEGHDVRFFRTAELANRLLEHHGTGSLNRFTKGLARCDLLILDELGFVPLHRHGAELLFNVIADCYERRSVIVTTNLVFGQWNTVLSDDRLTAALVDRLVHHAHIIGFTGESYRLRHALTEMENSMSVAKGVDAIGD